MDKFMVCFCLGHRPGSRTECTVVPFLPAVRALAMARRVKRRLAVCPSRSTSPRRCVLSVDTWAPPGDGLARSPSRSDSRATMPAGREKNPTGGAIETASGCS